MQLLSIRRWLRSLFLNDSLGRDFAPQRFFIVVAVADGGFAGSLFGDATFLLLGLVVPNEPRTQLGSTAICFCN